MAGVGSKGTRKVGAERGRDSSPVHVPFLDLTRAASAERADILEAISEVVDSGHFVLGSEVVDFEQEFADWLGGGEAVGVASGTDALEIALRAFDVGPGDEVVTQANTCVPTIAAIERAGAVPVLCDVEPEAGTMDPESVAAALSGRTKAVIPVHLYGQCADLEAIAEVTGDLPLIEDCAQAHGARLRGRTAGTIGACGAFSFYPTKNLGALGDGGMVVTRDSEVAARARRLRQYGQSKQYLHEERGVNSRLDEVQAAILRMRLTKLDRANARRAEIAAKYRSSLGASVRALKCLPERDHAYHLFVCVADDRESFRRRLAEDGVQTLVHYPRAVHEHGPYRYLRNHSPPLSNAEELASRVVSLPLYPELRDDEVAAVVEAL